MSLRKERFQAFLIDIVILYFITLLLGTVMPNQEKAFNISNKMLEDIEMVDNFTDEKEIAKIQTKANEYTYQLNKLLVVSFAGEIVIFIIYFAVLPVFTGGVTIGKKIKDLKVVNKNGREASFWQYFIRTGIIYSTFINIIIISLLLIKDVQLYNSLYSFLSLAKMTIFFICGFGILSKSGVGLHEKLSGTQVISEVSTMKQKEEEWKNLSEKEVKTVQASKRKHTSKPEKKKK